MGLRWSGVRSAPAAGVAGEPLAGALGRRPVRLPPDPAGRDPARPTARTLHDRPASSRPRPGGPDPGYSRARPSGAGPTPEQSRSPAGAGKRRPGRRPRLGAETAPAPETPGGAATPRRAGVLGYLGAAVLGIAIGAGGLAVGSGSVGGASPSPSPSPSPAPTAAPADNTVGSPDAPVTMEVWADYQCPFCRLEDLVFGGAVEREYASAGIVRIVYRDFAFLGQESIDAAVAARCAGRQEAAARLRYHDALYTFQQGENQGLFVRENLAQVAQIAGVPDTTAFTACLDDPAVASEVT